MKFYAEKGEYTKAIEYAQKALDVDEHQEALYHNLMKYYNEVGNMPMVIKSYNKAQKMIEEDLNLSLSQETKNLYNELIGQIGVQ